MVRVLNVFDQPGEAGDPLGLRLSMDAARRDRAAGATDEEHAWLLIGGEPMVQAARCVGLGGDAMRGRVRLMPRVEGFRRFVPGAQRALLALLHQADRVDCWTVGAAALVSRLGCGHAVPRFGQATLCAFAQSVIADAIALQPPTADRAALRERWGVDDATTVVALLADRPEQVDAREPVLAAAFTHEILDAFRPARRDVRVLCHPHNARRAQAHQLSDWMLLPSLFMQDAGVLTPWSVLPGCDLALAPRPIDAGLSILWAGAMGVPVIAPPEPRLPMLAGLPGVLTPCKSERAKHLSFALVEQVLGKNPAQLAGQV